MKLAFEKFKWYEPLHELIKDFKVTYTFRKDLNYMLIPTNQLEPTDDNARLINSIIETMDNIGFSKITRTKSGGISIKRQHFKDNSYDLKIYGSCIELTILSFEQLRIQFGTFSKDLEEGKVVSGRQAYNKFKKVLAKWNINLDDYAIENGEEINKTIVKPKINCTYITESNKETFKNINTTPVFTNAHHLDFHKAYMSQLYNDYPEFRPAIEYLYNKRHEDETIKSVFTNTIGFFHSGIINWKFANLAKDAINNFNEKLSLLAYRLIKSGRKIIAFNTDGIWYTGDIYHDELEGEELTQWSHDYINCHIRFKSHGAYEFEGTDTKTNEFIFKPVIRGLTKLDKIKPRSEWKPGDIFSLDAVVIKYKVKDNKIVIEQGE